MLVKEVMNRDVKTIEPQETVLEAASRMKEFKVGCLMIWPVRIINNFINIVHVF